MHTLYWFTRDLRLHDNAALLAASKSDVLLCVYVVDPRWFAPALCSPGPWAHTAGVFSGKA